MSLKFKHTILLVDDEEAILKALQRLFRRDGYRILTATSGQEGLDVLREHGKPVSLIISDQRMPGMNGAQFLEKARAIYPDAMRFLLTGYSDMDAIVEAVNKGKIHRYLTKPWNDEDLPLQVRQALEQFELVVENRRLSALTRRQNRELADLNRDLERKVEERTREVQEKNKELSRLNRELEASLYDTVRAFASLAEMHAATLAGHNQRVSALAKEIASAFGLSEREVVSVETAALLHDIGKLGLNERILRYDTVRWGEEDRKAYRKHPEEGQAVVQFIKRLDHVGLLIRSHHERYDGKGFPDGLKEESIPLGSQIIAAADAYDRIVHLRVKAKVHVEAYLRAKGITLDHLPEEELLQQAAIHHLDQNRGTRYDPEVVQAFVGILKERGVQYRTERSVPLELLEEGMVLATSLFTKRGKFLLPYNTKLTEEHLNKLRVIHQNDPLPEIYINP